MQYASSKGALCTLYQSQKANVTEVCHSFPRTTLHSIVHLKSERAKEQSYVISLTE